MAQQDDEAAELEHYEEAGFVIFPVADKPAEVVDPCEKAFDFPAAQITAQFGTFEEIKPGIGAILCKGLSKIAIYRVEAGKLHLRSAVCPPLGCIIAWNSTERSWDCRCHASRFDASEKVLNGPAIGPLQPEAEESSK